MQPSSWPFSRPCPATPNLRPGPARPPAPGPAVRLHAAGSLKPALTELARRFTATQGIRVDPVFGPSGLLRERLAHGEPADVFASADLSNPLALTSAGKAAPVVVFVRNRMCAVTRPGLHLTPATLLDAMLDPANRLGTSTPHNDPAGDYAWQVFAKAELVHPGARPTLEGKALQLVGAADAPQPPAGLNAYAWHVGEGRADIFLAYCTAAIEAAHQSPGIGSVELPPELAVGAEYGLTVLDTADPRPAMTLVLYILSAEGQSILANYGFDAPLARKSVPRTAP